MASWSHSWGVGFLTSYIVRYLRTASEVDTPGSICAVNDQECLCWLICQSVSFQHGSHLEASTSLGVCHSYFCVNA